MIYLQFSVVILYFETNIFILETGWNYYLEPGGFMVFVGGQQPGQARRVPSEVLETEYRYHGEEILLDQCEL